jgi:hypothetical protein
VKALVRVRGDDALASDLQKLVKSRVAAYKYPRKIEFVTDLPKTTTGKINRRLLTQWERDCRNEAGESLPSPYVYRSLGHRAERHDSAWATGGRKQMATGANRWAL